MMRKLAVLSILLLIGGLAPPLLGQPPAQEDVAAIGTVTIAAPTEAAGVITVTGTSVVKAGNPGWTPNNVTVYAVNPATQRVLLVAAMPNLQGAWSATLPNAVPMGNYEVWAVGKFATNADAMDVGSVVKQLAVAANQTPNPTHVGTITLNVTRPQNRTIVYGSGIWHLNNPSAMEMPRPPKKYEISNANSIPFLVCIPSQGGKVRQLPCVVNGLAGDGGGVSDDQQLGKCAARHRCSAAIQTYRIHFLRDNRPH